jgi:transposase
MQQIKTWCGIDVSAKTLAACRWRDGRQAREFANNAEGHAALVKWLGRGARVCVEATGVYHLQLALALRRAGVELMVVNPRIAKNYSKTLSNRSKTDKVDAAVLLDYVQRMEFTQWQAPSAAVQEMRELGRRLTELVRVSVEEKNRLHAKKAAALSRVVVNDIEQHVAQIKKRIKAIETAAIKVIKADDDLRVQYEILLAATGIGARSAVLLLTELAVLDPTMTVRELVAYAGLDPRVYESGTSVHQPARISKVGNARLRATLYMTALSAIRHDRGARAFSARLVARGKKKKQAIVAVMRKMLHGIWTAMQRRVPFDNAVLFAASLAQAESSDSAVAANQPQLEQDHPQGRSEAKELPQQLDPARAEATHSGRRNKPSSAVLVRPVNRKKRSSAA